MSTLNLFRKAMAFDDLNQTNAPKLQPVRWDRNIIGVPVEKPANNGYLVHPLATKDIFNGSVSLSYDATTEFTVALSTLSSGSRYRLSWVGGTDPHFRTSRSMSLSGGDITITVRANQTVTVTHSDGAVFGNVNVGDDVFIPGVATGDTALFNSLNDGRWVVLAATSTQLTLVRETGATFQGKTQTVSITDNNQFLAYSTTGVQIDNVIGFISGFSTSLLHYYEIVQVTSKFIEFHSSAPLPDQTVTPGTNSLVVYDSAKSWISIETDQEVQLTINGLPTAPIVPFQAGNSEFPGIFELSGVVYSLSITNNSTQQANVRVLTAE